MANDAAPGRLRRLAARLWYGPSGQPPTSDELAWQDDRVLAADGRASALGLRLELWHLGTPGQMGVRGLDFWRAVLHDANGRRVGDAIANQPWTAAHDAVVSYRNR